MWTEFSKKVLFLTQWGGFIGVYVASYFLPHFWHISLYGVTLLTYFSIQTCTSYWNHQKTKTYKDFTPPQSPPISSDMVTISLETEIPTKKVCLLVVGRRENPLYWRKCLESLLLLDTTCLRKIYILIDGSDIEDEPMYNQANEILRQNSMVPLDFPPVAIFFCAQRGKRGMLYMGIETIRQEFPMESDLLVVVTDSDTELDSKSLLELQKCILDDPKNGCATGILGIYNQQDGLLPRLIHARYYYAFAIERASLSYFGCMTCCSGPLSIYRLEALSPSVMKRFETQTFWGVRCEPGDDRHLTNLILEQGYHSRQTCLAIGNTEAPETMLRYLLQQLRWSRSFYRESYWQVKAIPHQSIYLGFVTVYESLFPWFVICWMYNLLFGIHPFTTYRDALLITSLILLIRTTCLALRFQDLKMFYTLLYFPLYIAFLLPTKLFANLTLLNNTWVTPSRNSQKIQCSRDAYPFFLFIVFWQFSILLGICYALYRLISQNEIHLFTIH